MAVFYKYQYTNQRKNIHPWGRVWRVRTSWQIHVQSGEKFGLLNTILNLPKTKSKNFAENPNLAAPLQVIRIREWSG